MARTQSQAERIEHYQSRWRKDIMVIDRLAYRVPMEFDRLKRTLMRRNVLGIVSVVRDYLLGYAIIELGESLMLIHRLAVDPNHQRQGIGTRLIEESTRALTDKRQTAVIFCDEYALGSQLFLRKRRWIASGCVDRQEGIEVPSIRFEFEYWQQKGKRHVVDHLDNC